MTLRERYEWVNCIQMNIKAKVGFTMRRVCQKNLGYPSRTLVGNVKRAKGTLLNKTLSAVFRNSRFRHLYLFRGRD